MKNKWALFTFRYELIIESNKGQEEKKRNYKKRICVNIVFSLFCLFTGSRVPLHSQGRLRRKKQILLTKSSIWLNVGSRTSREVQTHRTWLEQMLSGLNAQTSGQSYCPDRPVSHSSAVTADII